MKRIKSVYQSYKNRAQIKQEKMEVFEGKMLFVFTTFYFITYTLTMQSTSLAAGRNIKKLQKNNRSYIKTAVV